MISGNNKEESNNNVNAKPRNSLYEKIISYLVKKSTELQNEKIKYKFQKDKKFQLIYLQLIQNFLQKIKLSYLIYRKNIKFIFFVMFEYLKDRLTLVNIGKSKYGFQIQYYTLQFNQQFDCNCQINKSSCSFRKLILLLDGEEELRSFNKFVKSIITSNLTISKKYEHINYLESQKLMEGFKLL